MMSGVELGVVGAVVGSTLGAPLVGRTNFRRLRGFEPIPVRMAASPALDAWLIGLAHANDEGMPVNLHEAYESGWAHHQNESAFGLLNLQRGLRGSIAGRYANPLANGSTGLARAIAWGLWSPDAISSIHWAWADSAWDHDDEACLSAAAVALMVRLAAPGGKVADLVAALKVVLPASSRTHAAVTTASALAEASATPESARDRILALHPGLDYLDAPVSLGWTVFGLLAGEPRGFGEAVLLVAGMGGNADGNAAVAGAVSARLAGNVSGEWVSPLGDVYVASSALRAPAPARWRELVDMIPCADSSAGLSAPLEDSRLVAGSEESVADVDPSVTVAAPQSLHRLDAVAEALRSLATGSTGSIDFSADRVGVRCVYLGAPVSTPAKGASVVLNFYNESDQPVTLDPKLVGSLGVDVATRLTSFQLPAGGSHSFPAILQSATGGSAELTLGETTAHLPLLATQRWYKCGPFENRVGDGMIQAFKAEDVLNERDVFNGRSNIPVRWEEIGLHGFQFDVESWFGEFPGVIYLACRPQFDANERLRLVVASSPGGVVTLDRKVVLKYLDTHVPIPRPIEPYTTEFTTAGQHLLIIKLVRAKAAFAPLTTYFCDLAGRIRVPEAYGPLEA